MAVPVIFYWLLQTNKLKCSHEHKADSPPVSTAPKPHPAQTFRATRTESMAEAEEKLKPTRAILETIRERADYALKRLQDAAEERYMRWQCKGKIAVRKQKRRH